ncbi:MAG: N-acyl homoserine lactonase family protein [Chloroflexota bacterium]
MKRLYILDFGLFEVHENGRVIGIPGYLIQTHDEQNILVDTGFRKEYAVDAEQASQEDALGAFGKVISLTEENLPTAQLAKTELTPADINTLIMTHTDIDHVGGLGDFPQAKIVIHADERAFATPRYWNGRSPIPWPQNDYQLIKEDTDFAPGITLLSTPGHAPGHLSLLIKLPETGSVLLIGDAISRPAELKEGFGGAWNEALAKQSALKLMAIAKKEMAFAVYGHDPEQWPTLKKAPDFYA